MATLKPEFETTVKSEATTVVPSANGSQTNLGKTVEAMGSEPVETTVPVTEEKSAEAEAERVLQSSDNSSLEKETDPANAKDAEIEYPGGLKLFVITVALCLSVFLVALDNTIIATAIPKITNEFNSLQDVGWYGSAYLLTTCALQLFFGK